MRAQNEAWIEFLPPFFVSDALLPSSRLLL